MSTGMLPWRNDSVAAQPAAQRGSLGRGQELVGVDLDHEGGGAAAGQGR